MSASRLVWNAISSLVAETGKALQLIIQQVAEINSAVVEIASGAHEQATGTQEVNSALNQMDQVTQQNAAMVEEMSAASAALVEEAHRLHDGVALFRVRNAETTPVAAPLHQPPRVCPRKAASGAPRARTAAALKP